MNGPHARARTRLQQENCRRFIGDKNQSTNTTNTTNTTTTTTTTTTTAATTTTTITRLHQCRNNINNNININININNDDNNECKNQQWYRRSLNNYYNDNNNNNNNNNININDNDNCWGADYVETADISKVNNYSNLNTAPRGKGVLINEESNSLRYCKSDSNIVESSSSSSSSSSSFSTSSFSSSSSSLSRGLGPLGRGRDRRRQKYYRQVYDDENLDLDSRRNSSSFICTTRTRRNQRLSIDVFFVIIAAAALSIITCSYQVSAASSSEATVTSSSSVGLPSTRSGYPNRGIISTPDISGAINGGSIDLLTALQLHNTTRQGVSRVQGLVKIKPAYYLQGDERELRVSEAGFQRAAAILRQVPEFTVAAALRQEEANSGTIIAFSHGNNRYLELQSSGRKDELRLHYLSRRDGSVHVEAFPFRLADGAWHRVALSISGSQVELLVDCHPLYRRLLRPGPPDTNFTLPQLQLWVGQRNAKHFLFKGALQDVKLIPGPHGYLSQCPQLDSSCPTCGQFSMLQNTVEQLMQNLNELTQRLTAAEGRISKVEECECQKSCRLNGTVHEDGAVWQKGCDRCACTHGKIECKPIPCAPVSCKSPYIPEGECCPACRKQCYRFGVLYEHDQTTSPRPCQVCICNDGNLNCTTSDAKDVCPPLPCPISEQISVADQCCKSCRGVDYCAENSKCHINASCLNLETTYACHCNSGYQGDGLTCHDVDECKKQGGSEGHHCNANTKCLNTIGSYVCECLPGYHRQDKYNCAELDECSTGQHNCDEHATCINTAGSYNCKCQNGYDGDGYTCKPVCNRPCENGGECVAPGKCSCRRGYTGDSCELDLDECASDLHRCHHSSTCFNMQGWYYCRCKPGYHSALHDTTQGTQCQDIDECNDQTIGKKHTCHSTAQCINTVGGYRCACPPERGPECKLSCVFEEKEIPNGESFVPNGHPCRLCTCEDGVVTCKDPICNCTLNSNQRDKCCPQCDPSASCRHQDLHHLIFRSGERWIYQCQTCECLNGEIDCWQMECPPVTCSNPVTKDSDCCPRCEDDPCGREVLANGTSLISSNPQPCSYAGIIHESSSSWQDPHDKCTTCECKDGQLCCSYDYHCAGDDLGQRSGQLLSTGLLGLSRSATLGTSQTALPTVPTTLPSNRGGGFATTRAQDSLVITKSDINGKRSVDHRGNSGGVSAYNKKGRQSVVKTLVRSVSAPATFYSKSTQWPANRGGAT